MRKVSYLNQCINLTKRPLHKLTFLTKKDVFIYIRMCGKGRVRKRENPPSNGSFPNGYKSQAGPAQAKSLEPGPGLLCGCRGPSHQVTCYLPRCITRELTREWNGQDWKWCSYRMPEPRQWLNPLSHNAGPTQSFFNSMFYQPFEASSGVFI